MPVAEPHEAGSLVYSFSIHFQPSDLLQSKRTFSSWWFCNQDGFANKSWRFLTVLTHDSWWGIITMAHDDSRDLYRFRWVTTNPEAPSPNHFAIISLQKDLSMPVKRKMVKRKPVASFNSRTGGIRWCKIRPTYWPQPAAHFRVSGLKTSDSLNSLNWKSNQSCLLSIKRFSDGPTDGYLDTIKSNHHNARKLCPFMAWNRRKLQKPSDNVFVQNAPVNEDAQANAGGGKMRMEYGMNMGNFGIGGLWKYNGIDGYMR